MMDPEPDDIQVQVLETTLAEIKASRQADTDNDQEINCCVICLDAITEPCTSLPCTHTNFDFICLINWLQQRPTCPLCKASITQVRYSDPHKPGSESLYSVPEPVEQTSSSSSSNPPLSTPFTRFNLPPRRRPRRISSTRHHHHPPPSPDTALEFRRYVYRNNLYSLHVASNRHTHYLPSPPSPAMLSSTPHLLSRARTWIRRELSVFPFLSSSSSSSSSSTSTGNNAANANREFLLEYILAIIKTVDIQSHSGQAESMLSDFLLDRSHAVLFLHELKSWLRSPARTLEVWDREVRYPDPSNNRRWGRGGGGDEEEEEEEEKEEESGDEQERREREERVERGKSWIDDDGGDHWRPAGSGSTTTTGTQGERVKRKKVRRE
ncbi:E3 ubiquitin-protein ligase [Cladorrhinum sp. PSN259]|nr:E3 ubiquitin-protein ligase [Cladorrhinum sp. PSN259]